MTEPNPDDARAPDRPTDSSDVAYPAADAVAPVSAQPHPRPTAHPAPAHGVAATAHGAAATAHGGGHGDSDEEPLGPVDVELWGAGILGTVIGLFMAICFVLATAGTGAY